MPDYRAADLAELGAEVVAGFDARPPTDGDLPLTHLPADVETALGDLERRVADDFARLPSTRRRRLGEALFTLAEAEAELARNLCRVDGHDLDVISDHVPGDATPRPVAIVCGRPCGFRGYRVAPMGAEGDVDLATLLTAALLDLWADLGEAYDRSPAEPRETSIECVGLITRIVDVTRTLGVTPAEIIPPNLVASGVYVEVHRLAGHIAAVAPCTMDNALDQYGELLAERDLMGEARESETAG